MGVRAAARFDKGYQGAAHAIIPYKGNNKPQSQKDANRAKLRAPAERANAQLKTWRILRKLRCCPWKAAQFAKANPHLGDSRSISRMEKAL